MKQHLARKTAPRVKDGRVQQQNRTTRSPHYEHVAEGRLVIDRRRPGDGYRHVLKQRDIEQFLALLPDWSELSRGLRAIVLAPGEPDGMGWHRPGIVAVCAWERNLVHAWETGFVDDHRPILDRLGVERGTARQGRQLCRFTERSARGFQLMHILLHELGHHHDRMTTRSRRDAARGEDFAECYALRYADSIWGRYFATFGW